MGKDNITVTMPIEEYERLKWVERLFNGDIRMFENANIDGKAVLTDQLKERIENIYQ